MQEKAKPAQSPFGGDDSDKTEGFKVVGEAPKKSEKKGIKEMIKSSIEKKKKLRPRSICGC